MTPFQKSLQRLGLTTAAAFVAFGIVACKANQNTDQAQIAQQDATGSVDPAYANMAPGAAGYTTTSTQPTRVLGQNETYSPQESAADYNYNDYNADTEYAADQAPPPIPEYDQPAPPGPDWYWTPGYWAWGDDGYYWVPGTWVEPPYYGALWTPPYWGYYHNRYLFHRGYWGPHVGFYGGVDYGFGYIGVGYFGGYWHGHDFYYNRAVTNSGNIGYYYNRPVVVNNVHYDARPQNRVSYNGGRGGINISPRPQEIAARGERHAPWVPAQAQLHETAARNPAFAYNTNHGRPQQAAFARPEAAGVNVPASPASIPLRISATNRCSNAPLKCSNATINSSSATTKRSNGRLVLTSNTMQRPSATPSFSSTTTRPRSATSSYSNATTKPLNAAPRCSNTTMNCNSAMPMPPSAISRCSNATINCSSAMPRPRNVALSFSSATTKRPNAAQKQPNATCRPSSSAQLKRNNAPTRLPSATPKWRSEPRCSSSEPRNRQLPVRSRVSKLLAPALQPTLKRRTQPRRHAQNRRTSQPLPLLNPTATAANTATTKQLLQPQTRKG
ncbi:MAG: hypothetical protein V4555_02170 [Acidobacteriota bacterium]